MPTGNGENPQFYDAGVLDVAGDLRVDCLWASL